MRLLKMLMLVRFQSANVCAKSALDVKALDDPITSGERVGIYNNTLSYIILV